MTLRIVSISVWLQSTIIILPESATSSVVFLAHCKFHEDTSHCVYQLRCVVKKERKFLNQTEIYYLFTIRNLSMICIVNIVNAVHFTAPLSSEKKKRGTD